MCGQSQGACWAFIWHKLRVLLIGTYPQEQLWRPSLVGVIFVLLTLATVSGRFKTRHLLPAWLFLPVLSFWLIGGGSVGLPVVDQSKWGGLMLSLGLAVVGHPGVCPPGYSSGLGASEQHRDYQTFVRRHHRAHPGGAPGYYPVHGLGDDSAVSSSGYADQQSAARADRHHPVFLRLYGGSGAGAACRPSLAGNSMRPRRWG